MAIPTLATPIQAPPQAPPPGVTFDSAPVPASATPPPGVVFDSAPVPGDDSSTTGTAPSVPIPDSLHIDPNGNPLLNVAKRANSIGAGIGDGVLDTLAGSLGLEDSVAKHLPTGVGNFAFGNQDDRTGAEQLLQSRQQELEQQNRENPGLNATGKLTENVAEFIGGDAALTKGLSYGAKLSKVADIIKTLEQSPKLWQAVKIGTQALTAGAVQGAQTTVQTGGDLKKAAQSAALTGGTVGVVGGALAAASPLAKAIVSKYANTFDTASIQKPLADGVRSVLDKVAADAGVTVQPSDSIRGVVGATGKAILKKAQTVYQAADAAMGDGKPFQRFSNALRDTEDQLRQLTGIPSEDETEKALLQRKVELEAAKHDAEQRAIAAGIDPKSLAEASDSWKQGNSLLDLNKQLQQTVTGQRPEFATGDSTPEVVDPNKLSLRLHRMYNSGRLQQGLQDHTGELLQHADAASARKAAILGNRKTAATVAKVAGVGGAAVYGADKALSSLAP